MVLWRNRVSGGRGLSTVTFKLNRHMTQQMADYNTDNKMNT